MAENPQELLLVVKTNTVKKLEKMSEVEKKSKKRGKRRKKRKIVKSTGATSFSSPTKADTRKIGMFNIRRL